MNLAMDWMFFWVTKSVNHRRLIRENTINNPSIFLNMLKNLFVPISPNLLTSNYENRSCVKHFMMYFESNLTIIHKELIQKDGTRITPYRPCYKTVTKSMYVIFKNGATSMTCHENVCRTTTMHHQPTKGIA